MAWKFTDCYVADPEAVVYAIYVYRKGRNLSQQDIISIQNSLERYKKRYPFVSYLLVVSTTDKVRGYKKRMVSGRNKTVPDGKKAARHLHIAVIGNAEHSAYSYAQAVKKAINKRFRGRKSRAYSKGHENHATNFINYCIDQADTVRTKGDFDFYKYRRLVGEEGKRRFSGNP